MSCPHLSPKTLRDCVGGFPMMVNQCVGETVAYFLNEFLCLKLERGPFYSARRPMQYENRCCNFPFSYSIGLLLSLFHSFDRTAIGNLNGSN